MSDFSPNDQQTLGRLKEAAESMQRQIGDVSRKQDEIKERLDRYRDETHRTFEERIVSLRVEWRGEFARLESDLKADYATKASVQPMLEVYGQIKTYVVGAIIAAVGAALLLWQR